jgi:uroporphyrinogen decarboxylase
MNSEEYRRYGRNGDLAVLNAAADGWFNVLHLHGQYPMFAELADYPVHAINWHDRTAWPDLTEGSKLFAGALLGGVEQYEVLHFGDPADVEAQVHDAIQQMNGHRLIVTPGCTYPLTVPEGNLLAIRRAVETAVSR